MTPPRDNGSISDEDMGASPQRETEKSPHTRNRGRNDAFEEMQATDFDVDFNFRVNEYFKSEHPNVNVI